MARTRVPLVPAAALAAVMGLGVAACTTAGNRSAEAPPPAAGIERSSLFSFAAGDRLEDAGRMVVAGGRFARTEHFEVVRRADGGRAVTSVIVAAGNAYRVEGRWDSDAREQAGAATGLGSYAGVPAHIEISGGGPGARIRVRSGTTDQTRVAPCPEGCLVDMTPSTLPMFTLTRRYGFADAGIRSYRWIGQSLLADETLLDGTTEVRKLRAADFAAPGGTVRVHQYAFVETLRNEATGKTFQMAFNLYVDGEHRPLAFAIGSSTVGERVGYEGITRAIPPEVPAVRPPGG
jgi:hypothetical protein